MKDAERRLLEMIFGEKPEFVLELITDLDRGLQSRRPEYYRQLQPGVTYEMLDDFERQVSLKLPNSFRTLYQWKNGQHPDCDEPIEDNRVWMPLEDIMLHAVVSEAFPSVPGRNRILGVVPGPSFSHGDLRWLGFGLN